MAFSHPLPTGVTYTLMSIDPATGTQHYRVQLPTTQRISELDAGLMADPNVHIEKRKVVKEPEKKNDSAIYEIVKRIGEVL